MPFPDDAVYDIIFRLQGNADSFVRSMNVGAASGQAFTNVQRQMAAAGLQTSQSVERQMIQLATWRREMADDQLAVQQVVAAQAQLRASLQATTREALLAGASQMRYNEALKRWTGENGKIISAQQARLQGEAQLAQMGIKTQQQMQGEIRVLNDLIRLHKSDTVAVGQLVMARADLQRQMLYFQQNNSPTAGTQGGAVGLGFSFAAAIDDAQYGMRGVGNNLQQLLMQFAYMKSALPQGTTMMQAFGAAFSGPMGIIMGLSIAIPLITAFGPKLMALVNPAASAEKALKELAKTAIELKDFEFGQTFSDVAQVGRALRDARGQLERATANQDTDRANQLRIIVERLNELNKEGLDNEQAANALLETRINILSEESRLKGDLMTMATTQKMTEADINGLLDGRVKSLGALSVLTQVTQQSADQNRRALAGRRSFVTEPSAPDVGGSVYYSWQAGKPTTPGEQLVNRLGTRLAGRYTQMAEQFVTLAEDVERIQNDPQASADFRKLREGIARYQKAYNALLGLDITPRNIDPRPPRAPRAPKTEREKTSMLIDLRKKAAELARTEAEINDAASRREIDRLIVSNRLVEERISRLEAQHALFKEMVTASEQAYAAETRLAQLRNVNDAATGRTNAGRLVADQLRVEAANLEAEVLLSRERRARLVTQTGATGQAQQLAYLRAEKEVTDGIVDAKQQQIQAEQRLLRLLQARADAGGKTIRADLTALTDAQHLREMVQMIEQGFTNREQPGNREAAIRGLNAGGLQGYLQSLVQTSAGAAEAADVSSMLEGIADAPRDAQGLAEWLAVAADNAETLKGWMDRMAEPRKESLKAVRDEEAARLRLSYLQRTGVAAERVLTEMATERSRQAAEELLTVSRRNRLLADGAALLRQQADEDVQRNLNTREFDVQKEATTLAAQRVALETEDGQERNRALTYAEQRNVLERSFAKTRQDALEAEAEMVLLLGEQLDALQEMQNVRAQQSLDSAVLDSIKGLMVRQAMDGLLGTLGQQRGPGGLQTYLKGMGMAEEATQNLLDRLAELGNAPAPGETLIAWLARTSKAADDLGTRLKAATELDANRIGMPWQVFSMEHNRLMAERTRVHEQTLKDAGMSEQQWLFGTMEGLDMLGSMSSAVFGGMGKLFQELMGGQIKASSKWFKYYQAVAIAEAVVSTYVAANKALASAPYPYNLALVAGAIATGIANVMAIRRAGIGSSSVSRAGGTYTNANWKSSGASGSFQGTTGGGRAVATPRSSGSMGGARTAASTGTGGAMAAAMRGVDAMSFNRAVDSIARAAEVIASNGAPKVYVGIDRTGLHAANTAEAARAGRNLVSYD